MKTKRTLKTLALTLGLAGLMAAAHAAPGGKMGAHGEHNGQAHFERMAKELNLSAEQQTQMKALHEQRMASMKARGEGQKKARDEARQAWAATPPDAAKLEALRQAQVRDFDARSKADLAHRLAVAKILTPEQRQKMQERRGKRGDGPMKRKEGPRGEGQRGGQPKAQ